MAEDTTFELTLERIALIRRMAVAWDGTESGAPIIHPDAPYGSTDRDGDIENVTGDDEGLDEEHRALGDALEVFVQNAVLRPGRYQYHNPLAKLAPSEVFDLFRDEVTGETPEQISFEVTPEHLKLIPNLALRWDDENDVPGVDPKRPYGAMTWYTVEMAVHLGEAPPKDDEGRAILSDEQEERLMRLHREMQPVLQIFLRSADLAPGMFRQPAGTIGWEPV
ncbi:hypothetical protein [Methylobacterium brachythecii]|uniref:Tail assembly chaperone n=1 Tax=Methylobacterium brachythecii TaxID=1176177 RepID=A0A7W6AG86_9HYPH|nr:hypothetical protein [Methylobacterium brachythecii]MBB3902098.1 hypothetical protein [Methylobacterium brachythecii]GLS44495.1 hypothetical protein GCM10007884_24830 [Methylobacterium brachythecii]